MVVGVDEEGAVGEAVARRLAPHVAHPLRVDVVESSPEKDRHRGFHQRPAVGRAASRLVRSPVGVVAARMRDLVVEGRDGFPPAAPGKVAKREVAERGGAVAPQRPVLLAVAARKPSAVQPALEEAVPQGDVVAVHVLDGKRRALHVGRIRVEVAPVDAGEVAFAFEEDLAVVVREAAKPVERGESVLALVLVWDPCALAHASAAHVLHDVCVSADEGSTLAGGP